MRSDLQPDAGANLDHGHVLIVDDDPQLRLLVARYLQRHGYRVSSAADGRTLDDAPARAPVDLLILDVMLPGQNGLDICRAARARSDVPIIMLTARGEESDRIAGLEVGADDYVTKPFSPRELLARVRAVLRRARAKRGAPDNVGDIVRFEGWSLDLRRRELTAPSGALVDLSTGEFDLLAAFVENRDRVLSRERLMEIAKTRGRDQFDRTIDVQLSRLRKKLSGEAGEWRGIKTVRGAGYMFAARIDGSDHRG